MGVKGINTLSSLENDRNGMDDKIKGIDIMILLTKFL